MTTTTVISKAQYEQNIENKVGTLMFSDDFYDATHYVDCVKVSNHFGLKGKIKVIVMTDDHKDFKNIANKDIPYKSPVCAFKDQDGAYNVGSIYFSINPVGDAYIIN